MPANIVLVLEVSPPHPARLLIDAIKPFESKSLDPMWSSVHMTSYYIKRPANSHYKRNSQIATVRSEKSLLSRGRHSNEKTVGATILDFLHHLVFLVLLEIAIPESGKFNGWITGANGGHSPCNYFWSRTQEKRTKSVLCARSPALPQKGQFLPLAP